MRHRPTSFYLNLLANEVPGGAELASELRAAPPVLRVTDTQWKFMVKLELISYNRFIGTSIRVEREGD